MILRVQVSASSKFSLVVEERASRHLDDEGKNFKLRTPLRFIDLPSLARFSLLTLLVPAEVPCGINLA